MIALDYRGCAVGNVNWFELQNSIIAAFRVGVVSRAMQEVPCQVLLVCRGGMVQQR